MPNQPAGAPLSDLDGLPVKDGFRLRGLEMTRMETFTDAAFAFAVTLLVVSIDVIPDDYDKLVLALKGIPAFALSFALIVMFWCAHRKWSRRFGLEDVPSIILSATLVFVVLCYVYPLKVLASGMASYFTGGRLPSGISLQTYSQLYGLFAIYGVGFMTMCLVIVLLDLHAYRRREALGLNELERFDKRADIVAWLLLGGTGALSVVIALATPPSPVSLPGWVYMILPIMMPAYGVMMGRRRRRNFDAA